MPKSSNWTARPYSRPFAPAPAAGAVISGKIIVRYQDTVREMQSEVGHHHVPAEDRPFRIFLALLRLPPDTEQLRRPVSAVPAQFAGRLDEIERRQFLAEIALIDG